MQKWLERQQEKNLTNDDTKMWIEIGRSERYLNLHHDLSITLITNSANQSLFKVKQIVFDIYLPMPYISILIHIPVFHIVGPVAPCIDEIVLIISRS